MRKTLTLVLAFVLLALAFPASAGSFNLNCAYTRSLPDDPIMYPGQPGASHLHDFFGNRTTDAYSTTESLVNQPTSCQNPKDHAAYWAPAAYLGAARLLPMNVKAYYARTIPGTLEPFPTGLRMLAGFASATGPQPTSVLYFGCGSGTGQSKLNYPPNCASGNLQIHVIFPECGTGELDSADHRAHMAYATKGVCPAGYPHHFPQLAMRVNYDVKDARTLSFSSGAYYTCHADFWNAWEPAELARLVATI